MLAVLFGILAEFLARHEFGIAAQQDVRAAAGHVGGDSHCAHAAGLGHDQCFPFVLLGVQDVVVEFPSLQHFHEAPRRAVHSMR